MYESYSEPFCPQTGSSMFFTSCHQVPTGFQWAYIIEPKQLQSDSPNAQATSLPPEAVTYDFNFGSTDTLSVHGKNKFVACQTKGQIAQRFYLIWCKGAASVHGVSSEPITLVRTAACGCERSYVEGGTYWFVNAKYAIPEMGLFSQCLRWRYDFLDTHLVARVQATSDIEAQDILIPKVASSFCLRLSSYPARLKGPDDHNTIA